MDENKAIRYLMKEMDPSEALEFEKRMREDENLLIEVESLRATQKKLSALPLKTPPEHLTTQITEQARDYQSGKLSQNNILNLILKRGIAAAFLITAFMGAYIYYSTGSETEQRSIQPQKIGTSTVNSGIEPWVDRNDILRYTGSDSEISSPTLETEYSRSYDKLQLVSDPLGNGRSNSGILLTGSSD